MKFPRVRWFLICSGFWILSNPGGTGAPGDNAATAPAFRGSPVNPAPEGAAPAPDAPSTETPPSLPGELPSGVPQLYPPQAIPLITKPETSAIVAETPVAPLPAVDPTTVKYPVTQFHFQYAPTSERILKLLPPLKEMTQKPVELGVLKDGLAAPERASAKKIQYDFSDKKRRVYYGDALVQIEQAAVHQINKHGIYGVYVLPDPAQIDPETGNDLRKSKTDLTLLIYVSEIKEVRTVFRRVPAREKDVPLINDASQTKDPGHTRIRDKSPLGPATDASAAHSLLRRDVLQEYLSRINRFPNRRVDAAVNATEEPGKISLDYLIREQKPWSGYLQTSNTGTESTGEWRTRAGGEIRQLLKLDDILRFEYSTSDFAGFQSAMMSYEFTPLFPDYLKAKTYFNWGRYSAEDIGVQIVNFTGETFTAGASLTWTPLYVRGFPLDITAGVEGQNLATHSEAFGGGFAGGNSNGGTNLLLAFVGIGTERNTDKFTLAANVEGQGNLAGLANTDSGQALADLGRFDVNREFYIGKANLLFSFYVEPVIFGKRWDEKKVWWKSTRAHEFSASARGQKTFGDARLIPQIQFVAGGFNSVRGYPESYVVGDSGYAATLEYRMHVPRLLRPVKWQEDGTPEPPPKKFNFRAPRIGDAPDWDLIVRGFIDAGQTYNNRAVAEIEQSRTLIGAGVGIELQILKPFFISLRADWGMALHSETEMLTNTVEAGDSRFHFSATIAF